MIFIRAPFLTVLLVVIAGLAHPAATRAAAVYQLQVVAKPTTLYPTEGQKGRIDWTVTNSSYDLAIPSATLGIQLLSFPPGALTAKSVYSGKLDPNNLVTDLKILDSSAFDGQTLRKGESLNFVETFSTRDARSPAPFLNSVGIWNINTTVDWKLLDTGTASNTTSSSSVYVVDPRIATDISGGTTFNTPTAPASGLGIQSANVISYGWSFNLSQSGRVTALGFWDEGPAGLDSDHTVALWSMAGGGPLALVTVQSDSPSYQSAASGGGVGICHARYGTDAACGLVCSGSRLRLCQPRRPSRQYSIFTAHALYSPVCHIQWVAAIEHLGNGAAVPRSTDSG